MTKKTATKKKVRVSKKKTTKPKTEKEASEERIKEKKDEALEAVKKAIDVAEKKTGKKVVSIKDSPEIAEKKKRILKLRQDTSKQYGRSIVLSGIEKKNIKMKRFSLGSFWADYATGGGIPTKRFSMFWGEESTFKTGLALKAMADAQLRNKADHSITGFTRVEHENDYEDYINPDTGEIGYKDIATGDIVDHVPLIFKKSGSDDLWDFDPIVSIFTNRETGEQIETYKCAIADVEGTFDSVWFEMLGGIPEALEYTAPDYGEQAVDIIQGLIGSGYIDLLVIDSLAMIAPMKEIEDSAEKMNVGDQAKLLNKAFRKWSSDMNKMPEDSKPTVIMINQRREKITLFGNPDTTVGGKGQHFVTSLEIRTKSNRKVSCLDKEGKYPLYQEFTGVVNKNKTAPPKIEYAFNVAVNPYDPDSHDGDKKYPVSFDKGDILEHKDVLKFATTHKLVGHDKDGVYGTKNKYFVKLLDEKEPFLYDKKTDLVNEWVYGNPYNYKRLQDSLIRIMTGKA